MASVFTDNVECPLCGANTAHTDLEIHTNEREWDCVLDLEDGSTIQACELHPNGGSPRSKAWATQWAARKK
jgi:hypothetical protein